MCACANDSKLLTQVWYVSDSGDFLVVVRNRRPTIGAWVAVEVRGAEEIAIERYCGQPYIALVRWLRPYRFTTLEQWEPAAAK